MNQPGEEDKHKELSQELYRQEEQNTGPVIQLPTRTDENQL